MEQSDSQDPTVVRPVPHPPAPVAGTRPVPPAPSVAVAASEPHGSHEELQHHQMATPGTQTTSSRKPVSLRPGPIFMPALPHLSESPQQNPTGSPPHTPSILRMPSPNFSAGTAPVDYDHSDAVAGPSNVARQKQKASPSHSSEEDHPQMSGIEQPASRASGTNPQRSASGNGQSYVVPNQDVYPGLAASTSIRYPARAASTGRPAAGPHRHSRSIILTEPPIPLPSGNGLTELNPAGLVSQPSVIDHVVPTLPATTHIGGVNGHARRASMAASQATLTTMNLDKKVEDRLRPTLEAAEAERDRVALKAKAHAWALNVAIGAQVVLGALTTGVAAATSGHQTSIATSVLGGMSTLAASYLAKARGTGEPERSYIMLRDLESFIRDCQAFMLDKGNYVGPEYDARVERYRRRFEEILGNGSGGVGDQVQSQTRAQGQAQAQSQAQLQREKVLSPV
ncbi:hypothetical protein BN946_scf184998.g38 [Trametes cinnabarina]|uniref:SMODS and SLOG-associating 2TM effector domain-containing protein n=1 Tax=Pycnoporus cinnabarinus TaxID=5643 RepID=A0A060S2X7_PYCCI|nr:hypothetical protein BN946_scf184998.g38 [Trametes cinnabarina]